MINKKTAHDKITVAASLLLAVLIAIPLFAPVTGRTAFAAETGRRMSVSKTEFEYGEPILITAEGTGKDWVGLYRPDGKASLLWVYIDSAAGGVGSGTEFDILTEGVINDGSEYVDVTPGKYVLRLMPDDTSDLSRAIKTVEITVIEKSGAPAAPAVIESAEYAPSGAGFGGGTLTVKLEDGTSAAAVVPYWANDSGILEDYTSLPKFRIRGGKAAYTYPESMIIPAGATELRLFTADKKGKLSETYYSIRLPEGSAFRLPETEPLEFQVISDIHITKNDAHIHNTHFLGVMTDIAILSPKSKGIFVVGDMADTGSEEEYAKMKQIHNAVKDLPPLYLAIGNHDLYGGSLQEQNELFLKYAVLPGGGRPGSVHYDFRLEGCHFVFLGNDGLERGVDTTLGENTLKWLSKTLDEDRNKSRPVFLFIHQSLYDTVAGSLPGQGWNGVVNDAEFRDILFRYPEVIMFNGHSHWTMDSESNMWHEPDRPYIFNTASTAYLWTSYNIVTGENLDGSQGYYIYLYEDRVVVRGRDFASGKWIPAAQYCLTGYSGGGKTPHARTRNLTIIIVCAAAAIAALTAGIIMVAFRKRKRV
ncbi:MAG: metallophosphoesterase [Clostridia bacterium]|nr:metallophosphoesterase [Clostridia bacterium]